MNYALKELVGALRPGSRSCVGQSKHVGFRHDQLMWQKSVPMEPAWRVVMAELDSPNPVFSFGLLREEPADEQLAHWVDVCLDRRPRALAPVGELVIARKLWQRSVQMTEVLARHSLRVSHLRQALTPASTSPNLPMTS